MAGSIAWTLTAAAVADGTDLAALTGRGGWSSIQNGAGNTITARDAARMGGIAGHRLVQGGANVTHCFKDWTNTTKPIFAARVPLMFNGTGTGGAPLIDVDILRLFPDSAHGSTIASGVQIGADRKLKLTEFGTTTRGQGTVVLPPLVQLILMMLQNGTTGVTTLRVYKRPTDTDDGTTLIEEVSGTLATPYTCQSLRWGVGKNSAGLSIDTNDMLAGGYDDWLPRADLTTLTASPTSGNADQMSLTVNTGLTGPKDAYRVTKDGAAWQTSLVPTWSVPTPVSGSLTPYVDTPS